MEFKKVKPRRRSEEAELSDLQKKPELRWVLFRKSWNSRGYWIFAELSFSWVELGLSWAEKIGIGLSWAENKWFEQNWAELN